MQLLFSYLPTKDVASALALYRDTLGFHELWREGDDTVALSVPGTEVALMVDGARETASAPARSSSPTACATSGRATATPSRRRSSRSRFPAA